MQKLYYSISEVSKVVDEEQHILRYWEKQFDLIKPRKNRAGNRIYSDRDLNVIKTIKKLIREEKLSLVGTKEHLLTYNFDDQELAQNEIFSNIIEPEESSLAVIKENEFDKSLLIELRNFLIEVKTLLN